MIPDWLPNIHPLVVHFPIALLGVAVLLEVARLATGARQWMDRSLLLLYGLGTLGLVAAYLSGQRAAETVEVEGEAFAVLASHEDWALAAMVFFLIFGAVRFGAAWRRLDQKRVASVLFAVVAGAGLGVLAIAADRGGELVFRHGAGVAAVQEMQRQMGELDAELQALRGAAGPGVADGEASWRWTMAPGSDEVLRDDFLWLQGDAGEVDLSVDPASEGGTVLEIAPNGSVLMVVLEEEMGAVEGRLDFDADDFDGTLELVHNVQDGETYQYLRLAGERIEQGQVLDGEDDVLEETMTSHAGGWTDLRVQAADGHFYGHLGGKQKLHPHASQMDPGFAGLRVEGSGVLRIRSLSFQGLD